MKVKEQIAPEVLNDIASIEIVRDKLQKICDVLSVEFPFATFNVHHEEDHIVYSFLDYPVKRIQFITGTGTFCYTDSKRFDKCLYFGFLELVEFLNFELLKAKADLNSDCEKLFNSCAKSFNFSSDVANPKSTLFSNLITLKHKDNSFVKGLFGKNKYFKVLLTIVKTTDDNINYCVGSFDSCKDEVMVSSKYSDDLLRLLDYALKVKHNFYIDLPISRK